jgi:hypothetical protein
VACIKADLERKVCIPLLQIGHKNVLWMSSVLHIYCQVLS